MNELIQEYCDSRGAPLRIDRLAGVIRGVKILGLQSRNGRRYLPETLARAVPLYEGAKVNVNHPKGSPLAPRDYQDRIGVIHGVAMRPGEGLFGELHFNPKHALAEQLIWDAEHAPENVGFSHNVQARTARRDDGTIVEEIMRVQSVDLVADPATTRGLYESASAASSGPAPAAIEQLTLESLKAQRPDLIDALLQERNIELESLRAERAAVLLEQSIADEIAAAGVPETLVTELFRGQLRAAADGAARRKLILERLQIARAAGSAKPTSREQQSVEEAALPWARIDAKSFAERITA